MKINGLIFAQTILAFSTARILAATSPSTRPIKFDDVDPWVREYRGEIGDKLLIGLSLRIAKDAKSATGCYFYYKYCKDIRIDAAIDGRSILMREYDANGNQTGQFNGQFAAVDPRHHFSTTDDLQQEVIVGDWSKPDGAKSQSFYLQEESAGYWPQGTPRYAHAGFDNDRAVDDFMAGFRQAVLEGDARKAAGMVSFPIDVTVDGKTLTIRDAGQLLRQYDKIFLPNFVDRLCLSPPCHLFSKSQGVMLGSGEVWVSSVKDGDKFTPEVTAINNQAWMQNLTEDKAISFLENAPSFIDFTKRSGGHWSCMTDSSGKNEIQISVGHDHPDHFEVDESFKILSDGTVYVMSPVDGWKLDFRPKGN